MVGKRGSDIGIAGGSVVGQGYNPFHPNVEGDSAIVIFWVVSRESDLWKLEYKSWVLL